MTSSNPKPRQFFQDLSLFNPRHANVIVNTDYQITLPGSLPQRPKNFNTYGRECGLTLNTFNVLKTPQSVVHQYDVSLTLSRHHNQY